MEAESSNGINPECFYEYVKDGNGDKKLAMKNYRLIPTRVDSEDMIGKPYLQAGCSLRTVDWSKKLRLLPYYENNNNTALSVHTLATHPLLNQHLLEVNDLLDSRECDEIVKKCQELHLQEFKNIPGYDRKSSRLVVFDHDLADLMWKRLKTPLEKAFLIEGFEVYPLGFNVACGQWNFSGINEAMRVNQYESTVKGMFAPHRDAQFCPSGDERSILSLVIYLNDDFSGGQTKFYFPKKTLHSVTSRLTMKEELKLKGGLTKGYTAVTIEPKCGKSVLFNQSVIHEGLPLEQTDQKQYKYILKTDIMVQRCGQKYGFVVCEEEEEDYSMCIKLFRKAQQLEISNMSPLEKQDYDHPIRDHSLELCANELYEKCLSLRYCYPTKELLMKWKESKHSRKEVGGYNNDIDGIVESAGNIVADVCNDNNKNIHGIEESTGNIMDDEIISNITSGSGSTSHFHLADTGSELIQETNNINKTSNLATAFAVFPELIWHQIFTYLFETDALSLLSVFPELSKVKEKVDVLSIIPVDITNEGPLTGFFYRDSEFIKCHMKSIAKTVSIHSLLLIGTPVTPYHSTDRLPMMYPVNYNPETNEAIAVEITKFLSDIFYERHAYGAVFKVNQQGEQKKPMDDLQASVDQAFMLQRFKREFVGSSNFAKQFFEKHTSKEGGKFDSFPSKLQMLKEFDRSSPLDQENYHNQKKTENSYYEYKKGIEACCQTNYVGAAIVRSLKTPVTIGHSHHYCFCSDPITNFHTEFNKACETTVYNHLVADFTNQEFKVTLVENNDEKCCPFNSKIDFYTPPTGYSFTTTHFKVDITAFETTKKFSFNHAGCSCYLDEINVEKYVNLRSYPYLNHIHVIFVESIEEGYEDFTVEVFTYFGGIAAM